MKMSINNVSIEFKKEKVMAVAKFDENGGNRTVNMIYRFHKWDIKNQGEKAQIILDGEVFEIPSHSVAIIHKKASKVEFKCDGETYIEAVGTVFVEV